MKCKICNKENNLIFRATILNKYNVKYYYCPNCGFLQTEEPYWLDEAYKETINISDTGQIQRNINYSRKLTILLTLFFNRKGKYLDFAAGYGMLVRMMRDIGFDFYWNDKYTKNLFAKGFEFDGSEKIEAITTFESFEHYVNPIEEIERLLPVSKTIIFSTELLPEPIPAPKDWWYYGLGHGQHISFYSEKTFQYLSNKYNLYYYDLGNLKIFSNKKLPLIYMRFILKFSKFGLHKFLRKQLKSKTWDDYLKMSEKK